MKQFGLYSWDGQDNELNFFLWTRPKSKLNLQKIICYR